MKKLKLIFSCLVSVFSLCQLLWGQEIVQFGNTSAPTDRSVISRFRECQKAQLVFFHWCCDSYFFKKTSFNSLVLVSIETLLQVQEYSTEKSPVLFLSLKFWQAVCARKLPLVWEKTRSSKNSLQYNNLLDFFHQSLSRKLSTWDNMF